MNPFRHNLNSRCRNKTKLSSGHSIIRYSALLSFSENVEDSIPCYDYNGNIVAYVSETGSIESLYVYDAYGNTIEKSGEKADVHSYGFSTKYHDREVDLIGYQKRFYCPDHGRWLNRDFIEEEGGENLYAFCANNPILYYDILGESLRDAIAASI